MSILSSVMCTIGIFNSLCLSTASNDLTLQTFEAGILEVAPVDGTKIVFSRGPIAFKNAGDLPIFNVVDNDLADYLGMQDICYIEMKNNRTDFDTWVWDGAEVQPDGSTVVDIDTIFTEATLKEYKQSGQMNKALKLFEKQNIFEHDLNMVVFFKNATAAIHLSNLVHNVKADISKSCWNVLHSDPPAYVKHIPSIGITSPKIFGDKHISLLMSVPHQNVLDTFVNANIKELKVSLQEK